MTRSFQVPDITSMFLSFKGVWEEFLKDHYTLYLVLKLFPALCGRVQITLSIKMCVSSHIHFQLASLSL